MLETTPLDTSRTAVHLSLLFDPSATDVPGFDQIRERYQERMRIALDEDIAVLEAQQIGISSRLARPGRDLPLTRAKRACVSSLVCRPAYCMGC